MPKTEPTLDLLTLLRGQEWCGGGVSAERVNEIKVEPYTLLCGLIAASIGLLVGRWEWVVGKTLAPPPHFMSSMELT